MKTSQIIFLGLALFITIHYSSGYHVPNCGLGAGSDACGCSKLIVKAAKPIRPVKYADPFVIKEATSYRAPPPQQGCGSANPPRQITGPSVSELLKTNVPVAPRLRPVGDLCSCKTTIADVVPAYPAKPVCNSCAQRAAALEAAYADSLYYDNPIPAPAPLYAPAAAAADPELNALGDDCLSFDEQESIYNARPAPAAPADPVSLSLAYGLAQKSVRVIPESGLAFGPRTTPVDGSVRKAAKNIPEERLLTVERPVVELKLAPQNSVAATYNEVLAQQEALEQQRLELEAQAEAARGPNPYITFSDLGYGPVAPTGNAFVTAEVAAADPGPDESACGPVGNPIPGYVSGNVIVRTAPEPAPESDPAADYYSDEDTDGDLDQYDIYSGEAPSAAPCDGSSPFLARLRASALQQHPVGCGCGCGR